MDLNTAMEVCEHQGLRVRDDVNFLPGWTMEYVPASKLFYYVNPVGERAHKIMFTDAMRSSPHWRVSDVLE